MTIRINVDPTNPGQFFACCGLLELADRLWEDVEGYFHANAFLISTPSTSASLNGLLMEARSLTLSKEDIGSAEDNEDEEAGAEVSPLAIVKPVCVRLDWWTQKSLKTWAGSMDARRIFVAMCSAIDPSNPDPLNQRQVVFDAEEPVVDAATGKRPREPKKREPFYFDARRAANARSIDIGFAPDALKLTTVAHPVVEALCLLGLQRCRPAPTGMPRVFDYFTWSIPLPLAVVPAAVSGLLPHVDSRGFRFENGFRTDQRKHKAFNLATPHGGLK